MTTHESRANSTPSDATPCVPAGGDVDGLIVFADDWGRHPSSPQHLIRRIREHLPVLWVNTIGTRSAGANQLTLFRGLEKLKSWARGLRQVDRQMWVVDAPMLPSIGTASARFVSRLLVTQLVRFCLWKTEIRRPAVLTTVPHASWLLGDVGQQALVYYCTDDFSSWPSADQAALAASEQELVKQADLVLAVSRQLQSRHAAARRCEWFPHAVDFDHFASARTVTSAVEIQRLPGPRIGYFGLIYEKLDFGLLERIARSIPHGSLVMLGPRAWAPDEFFEIPNVTAVGAVPYESLPGWLAGLDVLLLPYHADDPMIRQSSPLKLRECLATGKPTVCVDVPEARRYEPHVRVTSSQDEFLQRVLESVSGPESPDVVAARQAAVEDETWDLRATELLRLLQDTVRERSETRNRQRGVA